MFTRVVASSSVALLVTGALVFTMHLLVETGERAESELRSRGILTFVRVKPEEEVRREEKAPEKPPKPVVPPSAPPPTTDSGRVTAIPGVVEPPPPPGPGTGMTTVGKVDGPLVNIIAVQPQYPASAAARGLEGTVLVRFDVTAAGTVASAIVLESSHPAFERAALDAVARFRYKPRTVDGQTYGTSGLRQLFRFELER